MSKRIRLLALWALLSGAIGCLGCHAPPPSLDAGAPDASAGIEAETDDADVVDLTPGIVPVPPHRVGANLPIPNPGDAGTVLTSNGLGAMPGWQPPAGGAAALPDGGAGAVWYESDAGTVAALPACANGQALVWDGGYPGCGTVSGGGDAGVTWANDLAGSSSTHQYVAGLSGNAGGGGAIPLASNAYISVAANVPILKYSTFDLMDVDTTDGYLNVNPPTGTGFNVRIGGTAGGTAFYADQSTLFSNATTWECGSGGVTWTIGWASASAATGVLALHGQDGSGTNTSGGPVFIQSGASTGSGAPGTIGFNLAAPTGTPHGVWQFGEGTSTVLGISPVANASAGGIAATSSTVPESTYLYSMAANASAGSTSTGTPGSFNFVVPVPVSSGAEGGILLTRSTSTLLQLQAYVGNTAYGAIYAGGVTPSAANYAFYSNGTTTTLNGISGNDLAVNNSSIIALTTTAASFLETAQPFTDFGSALGASNHRWSSAWISSYEWAAPGGSVNSQAGLSGHQVAFLRTTDASAHTIESITLPAHVGAVIRIRGCARVVSAGSSGFTVDSMACFEYRVNGAYNGTQIIQESGSAGVNSSSIFSDNANFVCTFTTSGALLSVNVQYGSTGSPTLDWQVEADFEEI